MTKSGLQAHDCTWPVPWLGAIGGDASAPLRALPAAPLARLATGRGEAILHSHCHLCVLYL